MSENVQEKNLMWTTEQSMAVENRVIWNRRTRAAEDKI